MNKRTFRGLAWGVIAALAGFSLGATYAELTIKRVYGIPR